MLIKAQLRLTGHVIRMEDHCIPKQLLYGELCEGKRKAEPPKLRYKDTLKSNLKWPCVKPLDLETLAALRQRNLEVPDQQWSRSIWRGQATPPPSCERQAPQSRTVPSLYPRPSMPFLWALLCVSFLDCRATCAPTAEAGITDWVFIGHEGLLTVEINVQSQCFIKWIDDTSFSWIN